MQISIIAAVAKNNVIGNKNILPWHLPEDLKHFKNITQGHTVLMGENTFNSIGKPLPNRINIVLSFSKNFNPTGVIVKNSLDDAIQLAKSNNEKELFIIGGASIYKQTIDIADKLYITHIDKEFEGDTYFPEIMKEKWRLIKEEINISDDFVYRFCLYTKTRK